MAVICTDSKCCQPCSCFNFACFCALLLAFAVLHSLAQELEFSSVSMNILSSVPGLQLCCIVLCCHKSYISVVLAWDLIFNFLLSGGLCTLALLCCRVIPDAEPALTLTLVLFFGVMSSFICSSFSRLPPLGTSTP